jgi:hypothetical protein
MKNFIIFFCVNFGKFYRFFHLCFFTDAEFMIDTVYKK